MRHGANIPAEPAKLMACGSAACSVTDTCRSQVHRRLFGMFHRACRLHAYNAWSSVYKWTAGKPTKCVAQRTTNGWHSWALRSECGK